MNYQGQFAGTVPVKNNTLLGGKIGTSATVGTARVFRTETTGSWGVGPKVFLSLGKGHWLVGWSANCVGGDVGAADNYGVQFLVDAVIIDTRVMTLPIAGSGALSGSTPVDITVDATLVRLNATEGVTTASSNTFQIYAIRIG